jgi:pilus assembly protein CpaB
VGNRRTLIAVAAVLLAAAAGVGAWAYTSGADQRAQDKAKLVQAYVAKQDIARGTSGDQIAAGLLEKRDVPRSAIPSDAVRQTAVMKGKVTLAPISAGQFVVASQFVAPGQGGGVTGTLSPGKVAITISVDDKGGVAGFINPEDHVNVIAIAKVRKDPNAPFNAAIPDNVADFVVQNVRVLAVGQGTAAPATPSDKGNDTTSTTAASQESQNRGLVTVEVTPVDAERIAFAQQQYPIYLTLVPPSYTPQNVPTVGDMANLPALADLLAKY